ncbi:3-oxoacyl-[acyl-carrier-protein] reductase [Oribacterium sinus]|uniref:3-oxoacyl-[acyl-carrier-protein] reductase n=1 Tax=Oribacterium sinus TaxID=237576 RepID=A0A930DIA3_9FIRM|nr:3-oxoacyl-[acyl-carrier-protein] reductase [Oribacterium sinus]MBF1272227.1 3-oxoacyl-[acyl-carrier-protein] reductase [Oribacterium sinus]
MAERETCLVTGASGGIGGAIALKMAAEGRNVVLHYAGNEAAARAVEEEIHKAYPSVETLLCQGDIKKEEDVERIVAEATARFSEIEVLVNNAGITRDNLFLKMSSEDFDEVLDANLRGAFLFSKTVGKLMMKKRYGRIIQISSIVGVHGNVGQSNYAASKAGLIGMSKCLAQELAGRNVTVNVVCPGFIDTKMTEGLPEAVKEEMLRNIPMKAFGTGEDVANAVAFFARRESRYITGETLLVDGGMGM